MPDTAAILIVFIILASVDSPTGELQYHDAFFLGVEFCWQFPWLLERATQFGIKMLEENFNQMF